jgi:hypothetical protein
LHKRYALKESTAGKLRTIIQDVASLSEAASLLDSLAYPEPVAA